MSRKMQKIFFFTTIISGEFPVMIFTYIVSMLDCKGWEEPPHSLLSFVVLFLLIAQFFCCVCLTEQRPDSKEQ